MITVICGEDSVLAFNYFDKLKKTYASEGYHIIEVNPEEIKKASELIDSPMLFSPKKIFFTQELYEKVIKKRRTSIDKIIHLFIEKEVELIDFEEGIASKLLRFPKGVMIKEFKLSENIFKLQESVYPENLKNFFELLNKIRMVYDESYIFNMLVRRIRALILAKDGIFDPKMEQWQKKRLINQAKKWKKDDLLDFYKGLYRIEVQEKTSATPLSIIKSLEILACYFL
ncbi:MAG: hypothetical protein NZL96_03220 [Patescibacteria group bacterium]|nr:hypothetical protein [Patescibacteria group bacterium]